MDLKSQNYLQIPFEDTTEDTPGIELGWMLEQVGCSRRKVQYLESNVFQFEAIDRPHLECLVALAEDPTQADTLLGSGIVGSTARITLDRMVVSNTVSLPESRLSRRVSIERPSMISESSVNSSRLPLCTCRS